MKKFNIKSSVKLLTLSTLIAASFFSCSDWFQGEIPMDTKTTSGTLTGLLTPARKVTSLEAPEQVIVSKGMYSNQIAINWKAVENATSYCLQKAQVAPSEDGSYKLPEDGDFIDIQKYIYNTTTYFDVILTNPSANNVEYSYRYYYRLCAENIADALDSSDFTDFTASKTDGLGYLFGVPSKTNATKGKSIDSITITWTGVKDAAFYNIYRDTREDFTSPAYIGRVRGNIYSYTNAISASDQGKDFFYKVEAVTNLGEKSAQSSQAMGYALQEGAPSVPMGVKVENGLGTSTKSISVSWDSQESTPADELTYNLYRTSSVDSVYTLIKKGIPETSPKWQDEVGLKTGIYYYYYVQAVYTGKPDSNHAGETLKSSFSESGQNSESPAVGFLLSPPASLEVIDSVENKETNALLKWSPAIGTAEGISFNYNIYFSDTQNGTFSILESDVSVPVSSDGYLYKEVAKKNFYSVSTVNKAGNDTESALSITAAPMPEAPESVTASKTESVSDPVTGIDYMVQATGSVSKFAQISVKDMNGEAVSSPNNNGVFPVKITWKAPAGITPAGYNVYRSAKPASGFRKLNNEPTVAFDSAKNEYFWIDCYEAAKAGTIYYYKVTSLNSLNQGNKSNEPDPAKETHDKLFEPNGSFLTSWGYGALAREQWFREYNKEIISSQAKLTLMHKPNDLDKVGSESVNANVKVNGALGTLGYNAKVAGLGAEISMPYRDYADHYITKYAERTSEIGVYYILNGNTDTTSNMSANGNMHETVHVYHYAPSEGLFQGMYPGYAVYNNLQIKGGAAGGGYYLVKTFGLDYSNKDKGGTAILNEDKVDWLVGEDH